MLYQFLNQTELLNFKLSRNKFLSKLIDWKVSADENPVKLFFNYCNKLHLIDQLKSWTFDSSVKNWKIRKFLTMKHEKSRPIRQICSNWLKTRPDLIWTQNFEFLSMKLRLKLQRFLWLVMPYIQFVVLLWLNNEYRWFGLACFNHCKLHQVNVSIKAIEGLRIRAKCFTDLCYFISSWTATTSIFAYL